MLVSTITFHWLKFILFASTRNLLLNRFCRNIFKDLLRNLSGNSPPRKFVAYIIHQAPGNSKRQRIVDRFSIIFAGRKTIESPMTQVARMCRRPTNRLCSPGNGMSLHSACPESQTKINERQVEIRLSSRIPRDVHSGFHGKATGRCVRNEMGFMAQTETRSWRWGI